MLIIRPRRFMLGVRRLDGAWSPCCVVSPGEIRSSTGPIVGRGCAAVFHLPENLTHTYTRA